MGSRAANVTAKALGPNGQGYASISRYFSYPDGLYAVQPGSTVFEFDWNFTDTYNGGFLQYAYLQILYENTSYSGVTALYLGQGNDWFSHANTTYNIFLKAAGFGSRGTWQHESLDVGALFQQRNIRNVDIEGFYFHVYAGGYANSSVTLLLDRFELLTYPTFDPGFEQDWYWSSYVPVTGWSRTDEVYPYVNRTSFAHGGKWAANLTAYGDVAAGLSRYQFVSVNESIYTDFWYRVDDITSAGDNLAFIKLQFDGGFSLSYVLASSILTNPFANDSTNVFYYVSDFNQTGTWANLVRNVKADLEAAFAPTNWNLTQVWIRCSSYVGGQVSVVFDDMNFVRDTKGPELVQALLVGLPPTYYRIAYVRIDMTDPSPFNVTLCYNIGSGWVGTQPFDAGDYFVGDIPVCPYGTVVHWFVNATDIFGHTAVYDNHGSFYSYVSGDDIPPVIDSVTPNNTIVNGWNTVNVSAHDPDVGSSGVSNVELWSGTNLLASTNTAPYQLHWNTKLLSNGTHTLTLKVLDNAGNIATVTLQYDIENVPTTTTSTTTSTTTTTTSSTVTTPTSINPLLIGAAGAAVVVIVLAIVCMKRRAK
jgi:hypothetical protein